MLGQNVDIISKVGEDELGKEIIEQVKHLKACLKYIQLDKKFSTGIVEVKLRETGDANYQILAPVTWDFFNIEESKLCEIPSVN